MLIFRGLVGGFSPTPLKNMRIRQNGFIFPKVRCEHKKYVSCHHPENVLTMDLLYINLKPK